MATSTTGSTLLQPLSNAVRLPVDQVRLPRRRPPRRGHAKRGAASFPRRRGTARLALRAGAARPRPRPAGCALRPRPNRGHRPRGRSAACGRAWGPAAGMCGGAAPSCVRGVGGRAVPNGTGQLGEWPSGERGRPPPSAGCLCACRCVGNFRVSSVDLMAAGVLKGRKCFC